MNPRLPARLLLLLGASLAALACREPAPAPAVTAVDSRGLVTSIRAGSSQGSGAVRVEGPPRPDVRYAKADIAVLASTRIVSRTGVGDRVIVEVSPYDLSRGRINFRHKGDRATAAAPARRPTFRRH